jgi:glucose/arabinose dehydrogenase
MLAAAVAGAALAFSAPANGGTPAGVEAELVERFDTPTYVASAPGRGRYLYVTGKGGVIRVLRDGQLLERPFLDISDLVADQGEQGLLSAAFAPDFRRSRRFFVYYTASRGCGKDGCPIRIDRFVAQRDDPTRARRGSQTRVISIPHDDAANHNGGTVAFGPDGRLWIATGDGGGGGDQFQNARDPSSLLGKLLRIAPRERRAGYRVPRSNPFVGSPGRDEIWSYGLRNPYRFSFDHELRAVAIGDVGQGAQEEVSIVSIAKARGAGFGWPEFEGNLDFDESPPYTPPTPPLAPIATYANPPGGPASVTGGVVARDPELPQLEGRYLLADFFAGEVVSFAFDLATNTASDLQPLDIDPIPQLVAFASGLDGQLYVLSMNGELYRLEPEQG